MMTTIGMGVVTKVKEVKVTGVTMATGEAEVAEEVMVKDILNMKKRVRTEVGIYFITLQPFCSILHHFWLLPI